MWKRKDLKNKARKVVKKNYWTALVVCFLLALFTSEFGTSIIGIWQGGDSIDPNYVVKQENIVENNDMAEEKLDKIEEQEAKLEEKKSLLGEVELRILRLIELNVNNLIKSEKYIFRVWDAIELFGIKETGLGVGIILIAIIALAYIIMIAEPLKVAGKKYFLEAREDENTKMGVMKEIFKKGNWKNVTITMLIKNIYNLLWFLTIIGGIIKFYEYRMIPYILADNPKISRKEAFRLSKEMMRHNKWRSFILDFTFILWNILSLATFGFLNILYVNPYQAATSAELYITLKNKDIEEIEDDKKVNK